MGPGVIFLLNKLLKTGVQKNNLSPLSVTRLSIWARLQSLSNRKARPRAKLLPDTGPEG